MFAESLIIVASACSNGACPPVVASNYQVQVQQPVQQVVQIQIGAERPKWRIFASPTEWIRQKPQPVIRYCTKGCK